VEGRPGCVHLGARSGLGLTETDVVVDRQYRVSMEGFYRATEGIGVVVPEDGGVAGCLRGTVVRCFLDTLMIDSSHVARLGVLVFLDLDDAISLRP
jgi:hypothetical protein